MAFVDLLCCSIVPITKIPVLITHGRWVVGDFACRVLRPLLWMLTGCSGWILLGLCWDRCKAISQPLINRFTRRQISLYCALCWFASCCLCIPYVWFSRSSSDEKKCYRLYSDHARVVLRYFDIIKDFLKGYIPITAMVVFLLKIYFALKGRSAELMSTAGHLTLSQQRNRVSVQRKLEKNTYFILLTTSAFIFCFLPSTLLNCVVNLAFNDPPLFQLDATTLSYIDRALAWAWALTYLNSAVNCFIYAGRFRDFQAFILKTFRIV